MRWLGAYNEPFFFREDGLVDVPSSTQVRQDDGTHGDVIELLSEESSIPKSYYNESDLGRKRYSISRAVDSWTKERFKTKFIELEAIYRVQFHLQKGIY